MGMSVGEAHAQLQDLALGLRQSPEDLLQRPGELGRRLVGLALPTAVLAPGALALTALALTALALTTLALTASTRTATTLGGGRVTGALIGSHAGEPNGSARPDGARGPAPIDDVEVAPSTPAHVQWAIPAATHGASMPFVLVVVALGVLVSYLRGGRLRRAAIAPLHWRSLLFLGVALQVTVDALAAREVLGDATTLGWLLLLVSQVLVVAFLVANRYLPGVFLVAGGLLLNAVVMAANGAMPVDPVAIQALGLGDVEVPLGKHTLMDEHTLLPWLADIIPLPPLRTIISVGDVVLAAGVIPLTHALMTYRTTAERRRQRNATDQA
jgi:lysylphosphatidylglycerol synthetase-like protein (DUF2156 family)